MQGLLGWYGRKARDLPWRRDTDPYRVLVSEVMLQQTRVETVVPRFAAWMESFPDVTALAAAPRESVMAAWSGLGYYRRAVRLHEAARIIAREGWPPDAQGLRRLPGIGDYTAAAVASICFGEAVPLVDGNVERVMARVFDIEDDVTKAPGRRAVREAAGKVLDLTRPGDWNQAVMDLGATVCTPRPACDRCPVALCLARERQTVAERPVRPRRAQPRTETMRLALVRDGDRVLLVPREGLLAGTWGLPGGSDGDLESAVRTQTGVTVTLGPMRRVRHVFTHRVWDMEVHAAARVDGQPMEPARWQPIDRLHEVGLSTAMRRALDAHRM